MIIPLLLCMVTIMVFLKIIRKRWSRFLDKEIGTIDNMELQRVPLFIRVPGIEGGVNHEVWWTNRYLTNTITFIRN